MKSISSLFLIPVLFFISCSSGEEKFTSTLIDQNATSETIALYNNLKNTSKDYVLYGHQDDLAYGHSWWAEEGRSDVKESTGSYPSVYGWDIGDLEKDSAEANLDGVNFEQMKGWIKDGYSRGGVITISWHMNHPETGKGSWEDLSEPTNILPGQTNHELFREWLDSFAAFAQELKGDNGEAIPIIFRPFHEHNGDWFWWGKGNITEAEYIELWRFTVEYLRDEKGVHNLIWAFSPDRSRMDINNFKQDYFYGYPGDDYVDIIGLDNYWDLGHPSNQTPKEEQKEAFIKSLTELVQVADSLNKIAALTESGYEGIPNEKWWTEVLGASINANNYTKRIAWVLTWRNANQERSGKGDHFYASPPNHKSAPDMKVFRNLELFMFEDELPDMYTFPKQ